MGLNFDQHDKRVQEDAARRTKKIYERPNWWTPRGAAAPQSYKNRIRFMPPWTHDESNPHNGLCYREIYVHFRVGADADKPKGATFACYTKSPGASGEMDPICEYVRQLYATKDPADAELAKKIQARRQWYSSIVDLDDPVYTDNDMKVWLAKQQDKSRTAPFKIGETKIQVWSYGFKVYQQVKQLLDDRIDFVDFETGFDVDVIRTGLEKNDTTYNVRLNPEGRSKFNFLGDFVTKNINLDNIMAYAAPEFMAAALPGPVPQAALPAVATSTPAETTPVASAPSLPAPGVITTPNEQAASVDQLMADIKKRMGISDHK